MSEKNELSIHERFQAAIQTQVGPEADAAFNEASAKNYLPRIAVGNGLSKSVTDGVCQIGDFSFDNAQNLGKEVDVEVGLWRFHACLIVDGEILEESYDPKSETFLRIKAEADSRSKIQGRAAMVGFDFLMWVFDIGQFGVYFFSKTAAAEAATVRSLQGKVATLYSVPVKNRKGQTWRSPRVKETEEKQVEMLRATKSATPSQLEKALDMWENPTPFNERAKRAETEIAR